MPALTPEQEMLKKAALASNEGPWTSPQFSALATPAAILALLARLEAVQAVPDWYVRHPLTQVECWADMYTHEGGMALIVQMLRSYGAMLAAYPDFGAIPGEPGQ